MPTIETDADIQIALSTVVQLQMFGATDRAVNLERILERMLAAETTVHFWRDRGSWPAPATSNCHEVEAKEASLRG